MGHTSRHFKAAGETSQDTITASVTQLGIDLYEIASPSYPLNPGEIFSRFHFSFH
jgi:hypothetical protein